MQQHKAIKKLHLNIEKQGIIYLPVGLLKLYTVDHACLLRVVYSACQQTYDPFLSCMGHSGANKNSLFAS